MPQNATTGVLELPSITKPIAGIVLVASLSARATLPDEFMYTAL